MGPKLGRILAWWFQLKVFYVMHFNGGWNQVGKAERSRRGLMGNLYIII